MPVYPDGTTVNEAEWYRLLQSVPASYSIWKDGSNYFAESLISSGTDYGPDTFATVFNQAVAALSGSGKIGIRAGTHIVNANPVINQHGITVEGEGQKTILQAATGCTRLIDIDDVQYTRIANIQLFGNGIATNCIHADTLNVAGSEGRVWIENVLAHTTVGAPISINNCNILHIQRTYSHTGTRAIDLNSCGHGWVTDSNFEDATQDNIFLASTSDISFDNCKTDLADQNGVHISFQDNRLFFSNCRVLNSNYHGMRVQNTVTGPVMIDNCLIENPSKNPTNTYDGIAIEAAGVVSANNLRIKDATPTMRYAINDVGGGNLFVGGRIDAGFTAIINGTPILHHVQGYVNENCGESIGTGAQETIAHGLSGTPNYVRFFDKDGTDRADAYEAAAADAANIYPLALLNKSYYWEAKII